MKKETKEPEWSGLFVFLLCALLPGATIEPDDDTHPINHMVVFVGFWMCRIGMWIMILSLILTPLSHGN